MDDKTRKCKTRKKKKKSPECIAHSSGTTLEWKLMGFFCNDFFRTKIKGGGTTSKTKRNCKTTESLRTENSGADSRMINSPGNVSSKQSTNAARTHKGVPCTAHIHDETNNLTLQSHHLLKLQANAVCSFTFLSLFTLNFAKK